jgi:hypothetical protein
MDTILPSPKFDVVLHGNGSYDCIAHGDGCSSEICIIADGNLVVMPGAKLATETVATLKTIPVLRGERWPIQAAAIDAATSADVVVLW